MPDTRPPIPEPVKRMVRQLCGFGCVLCGLPLYEYDHIIPWSKVKKHEPDNIVLLCDRHHREKTSGLLPVEAISAARRQPRNLKQDKSPPYNLHYSGTHCRSVIGSNVHEWPQLGPDVFTIPLLIDTTPLILFRIQNGHLLLTAQLFDSANRLLAQIIDNQLVYATTAWDVEFVGKTLTIRGGPGDIFVRMRFEAPTTVVVERGHLWRNGIELDITPDRLLLANNNSTIMGCEAINCMVGISIGDCPPGIGSAILFGSRRNNFTQHPTVERRVLTIVKEG